MPGSANQRQPATLAISVVVFHPDPAWLKRTLVSVRISLETAVRAGSISGAKVFLVDNGATSAESEWRSLVYESLASQATAIDADIIAGQGNLGYGAANNLAFARTCDCEYLLALNPDVEVAGDAIDVAIRYMAETPGCGMVTPVATSPDGNPLYLVKNYPRLITLLVRGFAPMAVASLFRRRLDAYDRIDQPYDARLADVRIASGCFMLMRRTACDKATGFDPGFFLYFEDFDLSYRISAFAEVTRLPGCRIIHAGGNASRKGLRHVWMFVRSAIRFFGKHGWQW